MPIKQKLTLVFLLSTSTALFMACGALFVYETYTFRQDLKSKVATQGRIIADLINAAVTFNDTQNAAKYLGSLSAEPSIRGACIYLPDGAVFAEYTREESRVEFPDEPGPDGHRFQPEYLELVYPIYDEESRDLRIGSLYLRSGYQALDQRLQLYLAVTGLVLLLSFLVAFLLSARLQRAISQPILDLARTVRLISEHQDYSVRAVKQSEDEIGGYTDAFNQMLAQIQQQDAALRKAKSELEKRVQERTQALQQLQRQHELILNSAGEGIYGLDLEGRMTFVNPTAAKTTGWTVDELVGSHEHRVLPHARPDGTPYPAGQCPVCNAFDHAKPFHSTDETLRRRDGTRFHAEYVRTPILENDRMVGAVVIFKDITERKQAEEALARQTQELDLFPLQF
jgi:PAS domain S-box-containing protein